MTIQNGTGEKMPKGTTHMLIVCDTFSYENYPVYVSGEKELAEAREKYSKNMQKIMEVIPITTPEKEEEVETKYLRGDRVCDNCEDGKNLAEDHECFDCGMTKERELACEILGEFEEFLERYNIKIPNEERDEYDADEGTETAILFGSQYYTLEDTLAEMIKKFKLRLFKK